MKLKLLLVPLCDRGLCGGEGRDEIQTKGVFLLAIHSHLYSFALRFIILQTHSTSYSFYTVMEKGGKPDRKPYHLPNGLGNPYRNLKSEDSQDQKPHRNYRFINLASDKSSHEIVI
jgi:hypothetical protein